jgi:hypothetical protein
MMLRATREGATTSPDIPILKEAKAENAKLQYLSCRNRAIALIEISARVNECNGDLTPTTNWHYCQYVLKCSRLNITVSFSKELS